MSTHKLHQRLAFQMLEIKCCHGSHCTCRLLAQACGCDSANVTFAFCRSVLQRRWVMECDHGSLFVETPKRSSESWRGFGEMDSVKAILVKND